MLGGQTSTLLLTCLSLASLFLSHTFFSPTTSLSLSSPHTQTLVTIKQVVLSSCLSPCLYLCAIYELSQLFLTLEPQLTPGICMPMCTLLHAHTHTHTLADIYTQFALSFALSHCGCPFTLSSQATSQSVPEGHSLCQSVCKPVFTHAPQPRTFPDLTPHLNQRIIYSLKIVDCI